MEFEKKENNPKVTMLRGSENRFKIGFITTNKIERINPLKTRVSIPPLILTPARV